MTEEALYEVRLEGFRGEGERVRDKRGGRREKKCVVGLVEKVYGVEMLPEMREERYQGLCITT